MEKRLQGYDRRRFTYDAYIPERRCGQDAGEMLLDIEARIGELAEKEPKTVSSRKDGRFQPSGKPLKHERLGLSSESQMKKSQQIHSHPDIVAKVKAEAQRQ